MKLRCSIWILWTTLACTTAPNIIQSPITPALSFVVSSTGVYELEDTAALIWRNDDKFPTEEAFYFSHMTFACSELRMRSRLTMENRSTTRSLAFIYEVAEPQKIRNFQTHPQFCEQQKKYYASAVPIIRLNNRYEVNPKMIGNRSRQEFSIGYEVSDDCGKLNEKGLPSMERFEGLAKDSGWLESFKVIYDTENLITRQVSYELNFLGLSETAPGNCENFEVGMGLEFFKDVSFSRTYRGAQIGARSLSDFVRRGGSLSQSVNRANVSTFPSSSAQNESYQYKLVEKDVPNFKKQRLIMQPEGSQPSDDESYGNDDNELIYNKHTRWDSEEYFGLRPLTDSNNPTTSTPSSKTQGESSESIERSQPSTAAVEEQSDEEYMVMQQLAPIEYFDVFSIQWSTCTYLNLVPMWVSLANGPWKKVDQAIRKMLYVIDKLSIVAGTYGVLKLPKQNSKNRNKVVFLRTITRNISVPEMFYKLVIHEVPTPELNDASMLYGIIIVMHNDFGVPTNRICSKDPPNLCAQYGWDVGSEPYCCRPSTRILELLDITSYSSPVNDFNLNSVLVKIAETGERVVQNYNQFQFKQYPVVAKKKGKTKELNDIYF